MKIPVILAQEPVAIAPRPRPPGGNGQGGAILGHGLAQLGRGIAVFAEAEQARRDLQIKSDLHGAKAEFELGLATLDSDLRLTERDPNAYTQRWEIGAKEAQERVSKGLANPESRQHFDELAPSLLLNNQVAVLKHRNTLFIDQQEGALTRTLDQRKTLAGLSALDKPEDFVRHYREAITAITESEPILGTKRAEELRIKTRNDFLEERALRHRDQDPASFLEQLGTTYVGMDAKTRDRFAEVARKQLDQQQKDARVEFERNMKAQSEEAERRMLDVMIDPGMSRADRLARLNDFRELQLVSSEKIEHFERLITQDFAARPSDPAVKIGVDRLLYQATPGMTHGELDRFAQEHAHGRPGLNPADYSTAKQYLAGWQRHEVERGENKAETYLGRAQAQAEQRIRESIGMVSPMDQLDPENKKLLDQAMEQLTNRSSYFKESKGGTEDPLRVADEIIPILQQARMMDIGVGKSTLQRWAGALQAAKDAGEISEMTYRSQRAQIEKRFKELERRQQLLPPATGGGTAPKPPGIFQKQTGKPGG